MSAKQQQQASTPPLEVETGRTFRIKPGSKLDIVMKFWDSHPQYGRKEVQHATKSTWATVVGVAEIGRDADNYRIGHYFDIQPQNIIHVDNARVGGSGATGAALPAVEPMKWPQTPVVDEPLSHFVKPTWYESMSKMVELGRHVSISGPASVGKTTAVMQLAAEQHMPLVQVNADVGLRRRDLTGSVELVNGSTTFVTGEYAAAAIMGWWACINEVNAAEPDALLFLNSQIAPPHIVNLHGKSYPVHPAFRLFVTYNAGFIGTKQLPESFKDRFFPIKVQFPTRAQLANLLRKNGMPEEPWADKVVEFGISAWSAHERGMMRYQVTIRRLLDVVALVQAGWKLREALMDAVVATIDNPAESKAMVDVLNQCKPELTP